MKSNIDITLDQLLVLETINRLGTFASAARELHRVTSAVSYAVKSLEESLNLTLFDRSGHRAALTPDGRRILKEAQAVLQTVRRLEQVGQELGGGWESELSIVIDGVYPISPVIAALRAFNSRDLPTQVHLRVEYLTGVPHRFHSDDAELMLVLEHTNDPNQIALQLPPLEMILVAHAKHPLCALDSVDATTLQEHVELIVDDSSPGHTGAPHRTFLGSTHVFHLSDFHSKRVALREGLGFGWLSTHLARSLMDAGELKEVLFSGGSRVVFHPHLVHRRERPIGRAGHLFMEFLLHEISQNQTSSKA